MFATKIAGAFSIMDKITGLTTGAVNGVFSFGKTVIGKSLLGSTVLGGGLMAMRALKDDKYKDAMSGKFDGFLDVIKDKIFDVSAKGTKEAVKTVFTGDGKSDGIMGGLTGLINSVDAAAGTSGVAEVADDLTEGKEEIYTSGYENAADDAAMEM